MKNRIWAVLMVIIMCFSMITPVFAIENTYTFLIDGTVNYIAWQMHDNEFHLAITRGTKYSWVLGVSNSNYKAGDISYSNKKYFDFKDESGNAAYTIDYTFTSLEDLEAYMNDSSKVELIASQTSSSNRIRFPSDSRLLIYTSIALSGWSAFSSDVKPFVRTAPGGDAEFMQGQYYAILTQESIITGASGGATRPEEGDEMNAQIVYKSFVDTVEYQQIPSKIKTEQDGEERGLLYVLITSDNNKGDLIGQGSMADGGIWDWFIGTMTKVGLWTGIGDIQRNGYDITNGYIFYNGESTINRYYFNSIQDACKFVLYGTAGATPLYSEIGQTDYGYGYISCEYNNYDLTGFGTKTIPMEQYPMGRQTIILMQHDVQGAGRQFVYVDLNYYSRVSMIDPEYNLIIARHSAAVKLCLR